MRLLFSIAFLSATALMNILFASDLPVELLPGPLGPMLVNLQDTTPLRDRYGDYINDPANHPFDLDDPSAVEQEVIYDPETNRYVVYERIGDDYYRYPTYMTFEEYVEWRSRKQEEAYFNSLSGVYNDFITYDAKTDPIDQFDIKDDLIERLFGGTEVDIKPQGNIDITLGADFQNIQNPNLPIRQQRRGGFDFDMDINMSVQGKIGEKLSLNTNYNTNATFDFENQLKLKFDSEAFSDDDIIKSIEAGNVSLPLRSSLIQGSQSLFGFKTELQFGHLRLTALASQQKSKRENITLENGAQVQYYEVYADEYDANRHFLLSHYNRETFEEALRELPQINSLFKVTRIEVWVTSVNNQFENLREIVALSDLAEDSVFTTAHARQEFAKPMPPAVLRDKEGNFLPDNQANRLYSMLVRDSIFTRQLNNVVPTLQGPPYLFEAGRDFEQRRARKLEPNRYTLIPELGVLSLDVALKPDEVLAVAYEYTYNGENYQVGEFSSDIPAYSGDTLQPRNNVLFVKLLKSSNQNVSQPLWDLMMKNFYNIGAYQASEEDFQFDIYYDDPAGGQKRFLPEEGAANTPLLSVFNLDNLNFFGDPLPDGFFDFLPGLTINTQTGKVMFPVLEPFGNSLERLLPDPQLFEKYEYNELYDTTITVAREFQEKNRFLMKGSYKSSISNEISLGAFNIPEGSVTVRSGGTVLVENQDYVVDYQIGRVRIINDAYLNSGSPINVSFEDNTLFSFNTKTMIGLRADYDLSDKMSVGATFLQLWERPFTQKVNFGDDPINNKIYGLDFNYSNEAPWLTRLVDKIPGIDTREPSAIDLYVEGAALQPGHSKAINLGDEETGVVYLDDFDGAATKYDLKTPPNGWALSSIPQGSPLFPEASLNNDSTINNNRALLNWYRIERNIGASSNNDPYTRFVSQQEVFPNKPRVPNLFDFRTFDLTFYPDRRGPYNYDSPEGTGHSAGLEVKEEDIRLAEPETRWGGIMRELPITDFEVANYESIEFWMLNPFIGERDQEGGYLYINLGNVSEDVMKDGLTFYENGLPIPGDVLPVDTTSFGRVPIIPPVIDAFANEAANRLLQDVGLDGLDDEGEQVFLQKWLNAVITAFSPALAADIIADPANDNYIWFDDDQFPSDATIFERYRHYNNPQGNSPLSSADPSARFSRSYTSFPNTEDLNDDGSSEKTESYFEYKIPIRSAGEKLEFNEFITDTVVNPDGRIWYQFKIPINQWDRKEGGIQDFRAIKFMRMYLQGFEETTTLRFATLDLARNQWRKVTRLIENLPPSPEPPGNTTFEIGDVNLDEDAGKVPFPYINPPGVEREQNYQSSFRNDLLNEAALSMEMCNLDLGHSRAVYKFLGFDMRRYEKLKMFVHAESMEDLDDGDLSIFIRLGGDYINNYYEYEMPLVMSELGSSGDYQRVVWPEANEMEFVLEFLKDVKLQRNSVGFPIDDVFMQPDPDRPDASMKVKGNPNLGLVKTVMIGVRNNSNRSDFCTEVWLNELRLTGLDEKGGVAGLAKLDMQLADFGNLAVSGNFSSIGWGSLDEKLLERSIEDVSQYDLATNLELGKFFGEDSGIRIPFFAQYSSTTRKPQYDPYDLDVLLEEKLDNADTQEERDSLRDQAITQTNITSYNFTNVRKERTNTDRAPMPWDISNFSLSYAYTATEHSDPILQTDDARQYSGALDYRYNRGGGYIEPFKNLIKTDWLKFLKDFNFNPLPNSFAFRNSITRRIRERQYRFAADEFQRSVSRQFLWERNYDLNWNLTRSIKLKFTAATNAIVDELGEDGYDPVSEQFLDPAQRDDYLWDNIRDFGRTKNYTQTVSASYQLPFDKFGILDWISVDAKYDADYGWNAASLLAREYGNSITNGRRESIRGNLDFGKLYSKWSFLDKIQGGGQSNQRNARSRTPRSREQQQDLQREDGKEESGEVSTIAKVLIRPLLSIRKARVNWQRDYGSFVPGLKFSPEVLGMEGGFAAPGWKYLLGDQPSEDWLKARANPNGDYDWFTDDICQYQETIRDFNERWDAEVNIEPFRDFQIDVSVDKDFRRSRSGLFKNYADDQGDDPFFDLRAQSTFGSYSISYLSINTLFRDSEEEINELFEVFKGNLSDVSRRLDPNGDPHPVYGSAYALGYGAKQQEVVVPAFIAAYTDQNPDDVKLDFLDLVPLPNWQLTYNGLNKLPWFEDIFTRVSISHGYSSRLTVNTFNSDLRFEEDAPQSPDNLDTTSFDYYSRFTIPTIVIREQLSPLIRIDVATKGDVTFNFEIGKSRTLSLNPSGQELNETRTTDWTAGFGYVIKDVQIGLFGGGNNRSRNRRGQNTRDNQQGGQTNTGSDLRITCDFTIRDDRTKQHRWGLDIQARDARGQRAIRINPAVEYDINENMSLRFFFDYYRTKPYTSQTYPITNIQSGIKFRFTLN